MLSVRGGNKRNTSKQSCLLLPFVSISEEKKIISYKMVIVKISTAKQTTTYIQ